MWRDGLSIRAWIFHSGGKAIYGNITLMSRHGVEDLWKFSSDRSTCLNKKKKEGHLLGLNIGEEVLEF